jgi:polar amino acid transport system substrate-binding protein
MKRKILTAVFAALTVCSVAVSAQTITLVADEWPPFNIKPGSETEGYIVDIARKIFESHGYTVVYENVPWKRAIEMTKTGKYNGAIGASKNDARGFVFPSEEFARNHIAFYVKKGNPWRFQTHSSVADVTLGTIAGYDYRVWLNEYIEACKNDHKKVQIIAGDEPLKRNLMKMMNGRIDAVVDNEAAIRYVAKQTGILDKIECAGYGEEPAYIYIAFSPSSPDSGKYAEILSQGIIQLRKTGELQKILDKYGLSDWK